MGANCSCNDTEGDDKAVQEDAAFFASAEVPSKSSSSKPSKGRKGTAFPKSQKAAKSASPQDTDIVQQLPAHSAPEPEQKAADAGRKSEGENSTGAPEVRKKPKDSKPVQYLVDNEKLQAKNPGIACRASKDMEDRMDGDVRWGSIVTGVDDGDGWLRLVARYLPISMNGHVVLSLAANGPQQDDAQEGDEVLPEGDREYIVDNTELQCEDPGIYFCRSKDVEDKMEERVMWGDLVMGEDQGDGWLYMRPRFLPMQLQGVDVITRVNGAS